MRSSRRATAGCDGRHDTHHVRAAPVGGPRNIRTTWRPNGRGVRPLDGREGNKVTMRSEPSSHAGAVPMGGGNGRTAAASSSSPFVHPKSQTRGRGSMSRPSPSRDAAAGKHTTDNLSASGSIPVKRLLSTLKTTTLSPLPLANAKLSYFRWHGACVPAVVYSR